MTTSHRPTFESRKGRDLQPTAIIHSRQVAAHKQLKYRQSKNGGIDEEDAKEKFNELKNELLEREKSHYKRLKGDDYDYKDRQLQIEAKNEKEVLEDESYEERRKRVAQETKGLDDSSDEEEDDDDDKEGDHSGSDGESDVESSDDEDSDDEAELLKELEKIKKERAQAQKEKEQKTKEEEALVSNPLLNPSKPIRKSWRQDKVFNYKNNQAKEKTDDDYVNDLLRSDFHQKFLNRFVK